MTTNMDIIKCEPYFDDGDLILVALASPGQPRHTFRIHLAVVQLHPVLFDPHILAQRRGPYGEEPGFYRVELGDDRTEIEAKLEHAYAPQSDLPLRQFDVGNIPVVSELLRIAQRHTQYELARRAVKALARDWPTTLSDWDFLQSHIARLADQLRANAAAHSTVSEYLATQLQDPALVLKLARFYGFGYPLVPVFLTLSQIPDLSSRDFEALFTFPNFSATHPARTSPRFRTADYSVVASADLVRLATARAHLREEQVSAMRLLVPREDEPAPAASAASHVLPHHPQCMLALRGVVSSDEMLDFCFHVDALGLWKLVGDRMQAGIIGLCAECQALLSVHAQKERQRIWDRLPVLFQLV